VSVAVPVEGSFSADVQISEGPLKYSKARANGELIARLGVYAAAKARQPAGLYIVRGKVRGYVETSKVIASERRAWSEVLR